MTTNTEDIGHGCTCVARSARACHLILGAFPMKPNQVCECLCHAPPAKDDDEPRGRWPWVTDADVED